jgi:hypothetical protein
VDDQKTNQASDRGGDGMEYFCRAIRPILITFTEVGAVLVAVNVGYGAEPASNAVQPRTPTVAAEKAIVAEGVTSIALIRRWDSPGPLDKKPIVLVRTEQNAKYIHRLAKALIDNGFLKLRDYYRGPKANPDSGREGIEIRVDQYGGGSKVVISYEYGTETDPTYLFEMLIRGADADMKARLGPQKN